MVQTICDIIKAHADEISVESSGATGSGEKVETKPARASTDRGGERTKFIVNLPIIFQ